MKKLLLFSIPVFLLGMPAISQIIVLDTDIASIGATFEQRTDTMPTVAPGAAGASQTWNFSALASHDTTTYDAVNPTSVPLGARFTGADIAVHESGTPNSYFFKKSPESLIALGFTADYLKTGDTICLVFSNPDTMLTFPAAYNSAFTTNVDGDSKSHVNISIDTNYMGTPVTVPVDSVRIIHHAVKTSLIDAWGNLTLPNGTAPALRQNTCETSIDSIYAFINMPPVMQGWYFYQSFSDTLIQFIWWSKYAGNAIVTMDYDSISGMATSVKWLKINSLGISQDADLSDFQVYPNPAQNQLNVMGAQGNDLILYNSIGQAIIRTQATGSLQTLDVSALPRGMYILQQAGDMGMSSEKIILQ